MAISCIILILILVSLTLVCGSGLQSCGSGNMTVTFINSTTIRCMPCEGFETCPPGFGWSLECDTKMVHTIDQIECLNCVEGETFSSHDNREKCQPCKRTTCLKQEIFNGTCTIDKDTTICTGICEKGYIMNHQNKTCQRLENKTEEAFAPTEMPHMPISTSGQAKEKDLHQNTTGQSFKNLTGGHGVSTTMPCLSYSTDPGGKLEGYGVTGHPLFLSFVIFLLIVVTLGSNYGKIQRALKQVRCRRNGQDVESALDDSDNNSRGGCGSGENTEPGESTELLDLQNSNNDAGLQQVPPVRSQRNGRKVEKALDNSDNSFSGGFCSEETDELLDTQNPNNNAIFQQVRRPAFPFTSPSLSTPRDTPPPKRSIQPCELVRLNIGYLQPRSHRQICQLLDKKLTVGGDYRTLASELGYRQRDVEAFERGNQPTEDILVDQRGKSGDNVLELMRILKKIEREDVLEILRGEIGSVRCECGNCPDISDL